MSYTKNTWSKGDTVTSAKLNHMENGIADASGGYDLVFKLDAVRLQFVTTVSLVQGSFESAQQKFLNNSFADVAVFGFHKDDSDFSFASKFLTILVFYDEYTFSTPVIKISITDGDNSLELVFHSDDTVEID